VEKALTICLFEWKLVLRHRLPLFLALPIIAGLLGSEYGLFLLLPVSALALGVPATGKMTPSGVALLLPAALSILAVQAGVYYAITAALHSPPQTWVILSALAASLAIIAGRLHGR